MARRLRRYSASMLPSAGARKFTSPRVRPSGYDSHAEEARRAVSKHESAPQAPHRQRGRASPFETAASRPPQGEAFRGRREPPDGAPFTTLFGFDAREPPEP